MLLMDRDLPSDVSPYKPLTPRTFPLNLHPCQLSVRADGLLLDIARNQDGHRENALMALINVPTVSNISEVTVYYSSSFTTNHCHFPSRKIATV